MNYLRMALLHVHRRKETFRIAVTVKQLPIPGVTRKEEKTSEELFELIGPFEFYVRQRTIDVGRRCALN